MLGKLAALASRLRTMKPSGIEALSARLGTTGGISGILEFARENPLKFAAGIYAAYEGGEIVADWFDDDNDPVASAIKEAVASISHQADTIDLGSVENVSKFGDELQMISAAARAVGGLDRLLLLRNVLKFSDEYFVLYNRVRDIRL